MKSKVLFCLFVAGILVIPVTAQDMDALSTQLDSVSYSLGILLGTSIEKAGIKEINEALFMKGINEVTGSQQQLLTIDQANTIVNSYLQKLNEEKATVNLLEGQKFLEENGKKEGVITLPSGLQYKVIKEGAGASPADTSVVTVHYTGTLINGDVFDSSIERGEPAQFPINGVIAGWTEALQLMKPGANWILYIPPQLGYGEYGTRGIEPNTVLIFDVQLITVE
ncbi:MAG: FKBP-type peptidyl-prolyl cis-trans isomerase [Bacteroidales bacterium]|nr:FKBP-type peptidyl-prolyl cis-trans isomerase [Bacteroidales bacterium]MBN2762123.1 FKBP-type peptidyl-prolyl cis-trans isomerase [Bacteroidales bacterium]